MWEQSRVEARRDPRVWRGGAIGVLVGIKRRREWFLLEWAPVELGGKRASKQERIRLERLAECYHDGCGFLNCTMFCEYHHLQRSEQECGVCGVTKRNWMYYVPGVNWLPASRVGRRWTWDLDNECVRCGLRGCWDDRVDWDEYAQMIRLPSIVRV